MEKPGELVVYALGWDSDRPIEDGEEAGALLHGRIVVDGVELKSAYGCRIETKGDDFTKATIELYLKSA